MAAIQCPGCKVHITIPGLINCPRCPKVLDPLIFRERAVTDTAATSPHDRVLGPTEWFGLPVLGIVTILVALNVFHPAVPSKSEVHDQKVGAAMLACQQRIPILAKYGGAETPPYTPAIERLSINGKDVP